MWRGFGLVIGRSLGWETDVTKDIEDEWVMDLKPVGPRQWRRWLLMDAGAGGEAKSPGRHQATVESWCAVGNVSDSAQKMGAAKSQWLCLFSQHGCPNADRIMDYTRRGIWEIPQTPGGLGDSLLVTTHTQCTKAQMALAAEYMARSSLVMQVNKPFK